MPSAASLRLQIENALASRIPGALTPRPRTIREMAATGIPELDALLDGGLPIGAISEMVGPQSSGRTTLALATMAEMTQAGKTVVWIDTTDALDPESAAAAGVDLSRQLWVRCGQDPRSANPASATSATSRQGAALLVEGSRTPAPSGGCGSPHPRAEGRGLSEALDAFLQPDVFSRPAPPRDPAVPRKDRMVGTPSAPNRKLLDRTPQDARPLSRRDRQEQPPSDRQPSRRQMLYAQRQEWSNAKTLRASQVLNTEDMATSRTHGGGPWTDNRNNAAGRAFKTAPNAIAAGLPRFREMEARAQGQGHGQPQEPRQWKPSTEGLLSRHRPEAETGGATSAQNRVETAQSDTKNAHTFREKSLAGEPPQTPGKAGSPLWKALDQALRATDLLLSAGGFSTIVLDLGSIPAEFAWRIPLATWFRFRAAADRARTVLLLLTQHPCARSSAELVLRLSVMDTTDATTVLTGACFRLVVDRRRFETTPHEAVREAEPVRPNTLHLVSPRKQPRSERGAAWHRATAWTGTEPKKTPGGLR